MLSLRAQLTVPLVARQIIDWAGPSTPVEQAATVDLFNGIARQDVTAVQRALVQGARPNAQRAPALLGSKPVSHLTTPLDLALWLLTHDADECLVSAPNRESQPTPDLVETLIHGGATTYNLPSVFFRDSGWESHPACRALEHHFLDLLTTGRRHAIMTREARETQPLLFRSVVVATPVRNPHSWLHRAIVRHRWDAVKTWIDQGLVLNFPGSESACELLAMGWLDEPGPEATRTMLHGFDLLRPGLLAETDAAFRTEVVGTVRALAFVGCSTAFDDGRERLTVWLDQLLRDRPTHLGLTDQEAAGEDGPAMRAIMQGLEAKALRRTLGDPTGSTPVVVQERRRL